MNDGIMVKSERPSEVLVRGLFSLRGCSVPAIDASAQIVISYLLSANHLWEERLTPHSMKMMHHVPSPGQKQKPGGGAETDRPCPKI